MLNLFTFVVEKKKNFQFAHVKPFFSLDNKKSFKKRVKKEISARIRVV
tara:strand:- start:296 stop:439 length:144 start_codon:yes stop_codon:yes gene_type:complete